MQPCLAALRLCLFARRLYRHRRPSPPVALRPLSRPLIDFIYFSHHSSLSGRRLAVLSSPFGLSSFYPAIPAASAVFRPFLPLSGHSGSGHFFGRSGCISAISFAVVSLGLAIVVYPAVSFRRSCLSGCLASTLRPPTVLGRRSVRLSVFLAAARLVAATPAVVQPLRPLDDWPFWSLFGRWMVVFVPTCPPPFGYSVIRYLTAPPAAQPFRPLSDHSISYSDSATRRRPTHHLGNSSYLFRVSSRCCRPATT